MKLKMMRVDLRDLEVGDLVLNSSAEDSYVVLAIGITMIHSHPWIKIRFTNGNTRTPLVNDMNRPSWRTICRGVE